MATRTSYYAGGYQAAAPQQNRAQEYDGTAGTFTSWSPTGVQTASRALTAQEAADLAATDAANTADANGTTVRSRLQAAIAANATYLAIASPTNAQVVTQLKSITKQMIGIERLYLGKLDDVSDTA